MEQISLLLPNHFYPMISYRRVRKRKRATSYCIRFGRSLRSARDQLPAQMINPRFPHSKKEKSKYMHQHNSNEKLSPSLFLFPWINRHGGDFQSKREFSGDNLKGTGGRLTLWLRNHLHDRRVSRRIGTKWFISVFVGWSDTVMRWMSEYRRSSFQHDLARKATRLRAARDSRVSCFLLINLWISVNASVCLSTGLESRNDCDHLTLQARLLLSRIDDSIERSMIV